MRDYEEKSYYEIQLDNKQLILVFLAAVTVCALIFVLGVMVGKGQKEAELAAVAKPEAPVTGPEPDKKPPREPKLTGVPESKEIAAAKEPEPEEPKTSKDQYTFYDLDKSEDKTEKASLQEKEQKQSAQPESSAAVLNESAPRTATEKPVESAKSEETAKYTVQVMATPSKDRADEKMKFLKSKGYAPFLDEHRTENGSVFRVRVGRFADGESARALASRLKSELKLEPWVTTLE